MASCACLLDCRVTEQGSPLTKAVLLRKGLAGTLLHAESLVFFYKHLHIKLIADKGHRQQDAMWHLQQQPRLSQSPAGHLAVHPCTATPQQWALC